MPINERFHVASQLMAICLVIFPVHGARSILPDTRQFRRFAMTND
jgi:hypothetical protein